MAEGLVGGAVLSAFLQVAFDRLASREILDYFQHRKLNETLLKKLNIMLLSINTVIDDAEDKQISNPNVKAWLDEVKDAVYEAEDFLDEIDYEVTKGNLEAEFQTTTTSKVWKFFSASVSSFDRKIESRMKQVLGNLEYHESRKTVLGLKEGSGVVGSVRKLPTTSLVDEAGIFGRDDDKEMIINWLLSDNDNSSHFSTISIVGMGGLGKTTLAQLVYNDRRMKDEFELKAWICVSDDFDVLRVTRTIIEAIAMSNHDTKDLNMLQIKLKNKLTGKRFLLVLDDVWNENHMLWEDFLTPLLYGASGSRIVVTTRSEEVAVATRSDETHHLKQLSEGDDWLLFTKYAFRDADPRTNPGLEEIGRKITKKCKGLPLALKTMGSLLYTKSSNAEWNSILTSEIWNISDNHNNILPALRLSYHYLPSPLKRCFAYCSLFPKDYEFGKEQLVLLWMAEGLLQDPQSNKPIEEGGDQYFQDLVSRSFFQQSSINKSYFVMHDLLNDLARFVCGQFCFRLEVEEVQCISKVARHFSFLKLPHEDSLRFEGLYKANKLRTFLSFTVSEAFDLYMFGFDFWMSGKMTSNLLSKCKCLRVLSLNNYFNITELPDSIGNLLHLRYLDLSRTGIKKLPDSTCLLYNLQTLKLANCKHLDELPSNLYRLINLRHLDFRKTKLRKIPQQLGKLKNLRVLTSFYVGKCSESNIKQLARLNLRGKLSILGLQNVAYPMDAFVINLKDKIYLEKLTFEWSKNNDESQNERNVLEKLQPHQNLKELSVRNYGGTRFPNWFGDNTLSNVVSLKLRNCKYCSFLPSLGLLPSLKSLSITGFEGIVAIGPEFQGNSSSTISFGSLEFLMFEEMVNWEEWECKTASEAFPCLQELYIINCPKLKQHLPEHIPSLETLVIKCCQQLLALVPWAPAIHALTLENCGKMQLEYLPSTLKILGIKGPCMDVSLLQKIDHIAANTCLEILVIGDCPNYEFPLRHCHNFLRRIRIESSCNSLKTFPLDLFPKLQILYLDGCSNLEMISISEGHHFDLTFLVTMEVLRCPKFVSFPKGGFSAPKLHTFHISDLESLKSLPERMHTFFPSLRYLKTVNCPEIESFPERGLPSNLRSLSIHNCPKFIASRMEWNLHTHSSLLDLIIEDAQVESLPEPGLMLPTLISLSLFQCSNLRMLDYNGLCHLSSLKRLTLYNCPKLQCLPEEGLPSSLSSLEIGGNCPLLKQRCQKLKGEDWGKIAHIRCIKIDDEIIT